MSDAVQLQDEHLLHKTFFGKSFCINAPYGWAEYQSEILIGIRRMKHRQTTELVNYYKSF